jgi:SAM-dependent methyltransferase
MDDLPRGFVIREGSQRIHNPFTSEKLAALGQALRLSHRTSMLDLACGSGEMLCTWARDHGLTGTGVDISSAFIGAARARAAQLDVADRVTFIHGDAAGYIAGQPVGVASGPPCPVPARVPGLGRLRVDEPLTVTTSFQQ